MRAEDLTKTLDLTVLSPEVTEADIERACEDAREHHFAALCSYPHLVPLMADRLRGCDVKTCAVIDFPGGTGSTADRAHAAAMAVAEGADLVLAEGSMGLFDGVAVPGAAGHGASADLAERMGWPVVLVIDAAGQAQTAAAVAQGLARFRPA